jgi:regulator of sirC expression with transglutaminase-like and TPR domain
MTQLEVIQCLHSLGLGLHYSETIDILRLRIDITDDRHLYLTPLFVGIAPSGSWHLKSSYRTYSGPVMKTVVTDLGNFSDVFELQEWLINNPEMYIDVY